MTPKSRPAPWVREELLHPLSISATLAGLAKLLVSVLDVVFLVALTLMKGAAFVLVYTVW